jgi:hypothetical protein
LDEWSSRITFVTICGINISISMDRGARFMRQAKSRVI